MPIIFSEYTGGLRTTNKHYKSGDIITTDAPADNHGKGEAFSPTDMVGVSLSSCVLTVMGIYAEKEGIDMKSVSCEVTKTMAKDPRRVGELIVDLKWKNCSASEVQIKNLKDIAINCPVALSLHPDLKQIYNFDIQRKEV